MFHCRHACHLITAIAVVCGTLASIATNAGATGASTITEAGNLPLETLVVGGGQPIDFYRVALSAGDQIDINYDMLSQPNCGYLYLFDPTVGDFNLAEAKAVSSVNVKPGPQSVTLTSSFNGLGTLAVAMGTPSSIQSPNYPPLQTPVSQCTVVTPFSMTVAIEHLTQVSFGSLPGHLSSPRRRLRLQAHLQSPAGTPTGTCLLERLKGSLPVRVAQTSTRNGVCTASVRGGRTGSFTYRVTFTGTGWQTAQGASHVVDVG
jgi:hypothetical protein